MSSSIKSRLSEFNAAVSFARQRGQGGGGLPIDPLGDGHYVPGGSSPAGSARLEAPRTTHSDFTRGAAQVNGGIERVLEKLEKLAKRMDGGSPPCTACSKPAKLRCSPPRRHVPSSRRKQDAL